MLDVVLNNGPEGHLSNVSSLGEYYIVQYMVSHKLMIKKLPG